LQVVLSVLIVGQYRCYSKILRQNRGENPGGRPSGEHLGEECETILLVNHAQVAPDGVIRKGEGPLHPPKYYDIINSVIRM
jgi:hypothetical protein